MADKNTFVQKFQDSATKLAQVANEFDDLMSVYFDRGYNGGGADELVDGDISTGLNITAADVAAGVTLAQQLANFLDNTAVVTGDYDSTLNKLRVDL